MNEELGHLLARSLALLTRLLAPYCSLCSRIALTRLLAQSHALLHLLARALTPQLLEQCFFLFWATVRCSLCLGFMGGLVLTQERI